MADTLERLVLREPGATVTELKEQLAALTGVVTSRSSLQRALHSLGFSYKKSPSSPPSGTLPPNLWRRHLLAALLNEVDAGRLVLVDESFCSTHMVREYGWAPVGQRAVGSRPGRRWRTLTLIGAIRLGTRPKLMTHPGAINGAVFLRFVRQRRCPWLKSNDIVLMDNLSAHKVRGGARRLRRWAPASCTCPPTARTSTPSSCGGRTSSDTCEDSDLVR